MLSSDNLIRLKETTTDVAWPVVLSGFPDHGRTIPIILGIITTLSWANAWPAAPGLLLRLASITYAATFN